MKFKIINDNENEKIELKCFDSDEISRGLVNTKLIFQLEEKDGMTIVSFTHAGWKENSEIFARRNSTWGFLMFSLKNYIENGIGNPIS